MATKVTPSSLIMATTTYRPTILLLQILLIASSLHECKSSQPSNVITSSDALPSIWANENGKAAVYRFLGEINLQNYDKSYRFAETASIAESMFRFEMVEANSGNQFGYMASYKSGEMFSFAPFTCKLIKESEMADLVSQELGNLMPRVIIDTKIEESNQDLPMPTGIGSLWMYASKNKARYRGPLMKLSNDIPQSTWKDIDVDSMHGFVVDPTDHYPYQISLFFKAEQQIEPHSLVLIQVADVLQPGYLMRIRFLEGWNEMNAAGKSSLDMSKVFSLPIGYGCPRSQTIKNSPRQATSFIESSLSWPHLLRLNVVSLHPPLDDHRAPVDKWTAHSSRVSLVAGRLTWSDKSTSDYLALELQDFGGEHELESILEGGTKVATLRRRRRVWDLGNNGLASSLNGSKALHLDIDERQGKCLGYGQSPSTESVSVSLEPISESVEREESVSEVGVPNLHEMTMNNEFLQLLLGSSVEGFQLVQENLQSRFVELIFERRMANFRLLAKNGSEIWSGPVSLIRKESWKIPRNPRANQTAPSNKFDVINYLEWPPTKISGSVLFLSTNLNGIISKLSMELIERRPISRSRLHQQVSIAALLCYTQIEKHHQPSSSSNKFGKTVAKVTGARRSRHQAAPLVVLNYPLDTNPTSQENLIEANRLQSCGRFRVELEEKIYEQFLGLMRSVSGGRFESLRVAQVAIGLDFESFNLRIEARLVEQPALLSFIPEAGLYKFSGNSYTTELKNSAAACADSCRHLTCKAFVFCPTSEECQLSFSEPGAASAADNGTSMEQCHLYKKSDLASKRPETMSVNQLVGRLRELVDSKPEELALNIQIGLLPSIKLTPSSLESKLKGSKSVTLDATSQNLFQLPEYELVFKARRFKSFEGLRVAHHVANHHDCELLCSQLDCTSFVHCPLEQVCYLNNVLEHDNTLALEQVTVPTQDTCHVFAPNQLSKFQRTGSRVERRSIGKQSVDRTLTGGTTRDCAASCIHQSADFKCRSFYYCISDAATTTCLLRSDWHQSSSNTSFQLTGNKSANDAGFSEVSCQLYKRSYLLEFDKFPGRTLVGGELQTLDADADADGDTNQLLGADACAVECVRRLDLNEPCLGFQICRGPTEEGPMRPQCSFLLGWTTSGNAGTQSRRLPEMVDSDLCSVFVPAVDSQLFRLAEEANKEQPWRIKTLTGSLLDLLWELPILMGVGLAIGLTVTGFLQSLRPNPR